VAQIAGRKRKKERKEERKNNIPKIWVGLVRLGRFGTEKDEYPHTISTRTEATHTEIEIFAVSPH
jgi:hypothetical protein